ncbi:MAG TPA: deoxyribose-phosphate aldolase [Verrucomicrobiota bacterium]|nr:deoxyribose-phosphate aldolase [Verrucomicrobiales bacterium]HRI13530.1 deoxyribose-phosphate aldolase [Verrucomicrobiota bacterium]
MSQSAAVTLTDAELAQLIDHTLLRPDAAAADVERLCQEARQHGFYAVCVNGSRVVQAAHWLEGTDVKIATVVGFPLGAMDADAKRFETDCVVDLGAQEVDVVLNIGRLKDGDERYVLRELRDVVEAAEGVPVKVILECCFLTDDEKRRACSLVVESGARFVKTSTGFGSAGATVSDVALLRECVGPKFGVKAAGGIRTRETAWAMLNAGATRLGTSASVALLAANGAPLVD